MPKASGYLHFMKRPTPKKLPLPIDYSIRAVVYRTKHTYSWWVIFEPYGRNAMTTGLPSLHIIETLKLPNTSRVSPALGWAIPTVRNRPLLAQGRQYRKGRSSAFVKLSKKVEKARREQATHVHDRQGLGRHNPDLPGLWSHRTRLSVQREPRHPAHPGCASDAGTRARTAQYATTYTPPEKLRTDGAVAVVGFGWLPISRQARTL